MTEIEKPLKSQVMADVVQKWYADFVDLEQVLLFELILAANYMDIKPLLDLTCATVASMIKGKTVSLLKKASFWAFPSCLLYVLTNCFYFRSRKTSELRSILQTTSLPRKRRLFGRRTNGAKKLKRHLWNYLPGCTNIRTAFFSRRLQGDTVKWNYNECE